ncbi:hypothetical protein ANO11243_039560 [Dothideomycetidae sp. 11243]|nr:hypothetical protein ANO11243_039560 [fungal sp. No.11243]
MALEVVEAAGRSATSHDVCGLCTSENKDKDTFGGICNASLARQHRGRLRTVASVWGTEGFCFLAVCIIYCGLDGYRNSTIHVLSRANWPVLRCQIVFSPALCSLRTAEHAPRGSTVLLVVDSGVVVYVCTAEAGNAPHLASPRPALSSLHTALASGGPISAKPNNITIQITLFCSATQQN